MKFTEVINFTTFLQSSHTTELTPGDPSCSPHSKQRDTPSPHTVFFMLSRRFIRRLQQQNVQSRAWHYRDFFFFGLNFRSSQKPALTQFFLAPLPPFSPHGQSHCLLSLFLHQSDLDWNRDLAAWSSYPCFAKMGSICGRISSFLSHSLDSHTQTHKVEHHNAVTQFTSEWICFTYCSLSLCHRSGSREKDDTVKAWCCR